MSESREWRVPSTWCWVTMEDVSSVVGGGTPSTTTSGNFAAPGEGIAWITPADLSGYRSRLITRGARDITGQGLAKSGARLMPAGAVLFSSRAPIGYVAVAAGPLCTSQGFKSFLLAPGIDSRCIAYYLDRAVPIAISMATGTTFKELSGSKAAILPLPVPPAKEQPRIADALDSYLSRLDAASASLEQAQAKLKAYRASVLKAAVEGRLVPTEADLARRENRAYEPAQVLLDRILKERRRRWEESELARLMKAGKTPNDDKWKAKYQAPLGPDTSTLPDLPEGWCWTSLGQAFTVTVGATPSRPVKEYWEGSIPWVSSGEVAFCRIKDTKEKITQAGLEQSSTKMNPKGSVLIGMIGEGKTRGQAAILDIDACGNQNAAAVWVSETEVPTEYVYHYMVGQYEQTRRRSSGNNQPALNKTRIELIAMPLAPLSEMNRVVERLEAHSSVIGHLETAVLMQLKRAMRLRQSILKWAFEGKLVDQDPNDEPAQTLVARIRSERKSSATSRRRKVGRNRRAQS